MGHNLLFSVQTLGIVTLCALLYGVFQRRMPNGILRQFGTGLLFGSGAIIVMLQPSWLNSSLHANGQGAFLVMAFIFAGPVAAAITITMVSIFLLALGGEGALLGGLAAIATFGWAGAWKYFRTDKRGVLLPEWTSMCFIAALPPTCALMASPAADAPSVVVFVLMTAAITLFFMQMLKGEERRQRRERELATAASTDLLTGLPNRRAFERYTKQLEALKTENILILFIDIDHFKQINDQYGHDEGDAVLRNIGEAIKNIAGENDFYARIGGEEFAIIRQVTSFDSSLEVADIFRRALQIPFGIETEKKKTRVSIGGYHSNGRPFHYDTAYRLADSALYRSKSLGRDLSTVFHSDSREIEDPGCLIDAHSKASVSLPSFSTA